MPRLCARLPYFLHPKLRDTDAVPTANSPSPAVPAARRKHSPCQHTSTHVRKPRCQPALLKCAPGRMRTHEATRIGS